MASMRESKIDKEVPKRAEVVIIGGGSIGLSVAYHLARKGCSDVVVLEKASLGSGSTGKSAGGIRQQFSTEVNIRLSQYGVQVFERFDKDMDAHAEFRQFGYLFLATTESEVDLFRRNVALQQSLGVPVHLITPQDAKTLVPGLNIEDVLAATYCPTDGYADPYGVVAGYARQARNLGVMILEDTEAVGIRVERGRVGGVATASGFIATSTVVNATGPWGRLIGEMVGVDLPVQPYRLQEFVTGPVPDLPERLPLTVEFSTHLHFRREGDGALIGWNDPNDGPSFDDTLRWDDVERVVERALHRIPGLARASVRRGWAGLCEMTPDSNAIIGPIPQVEGFLCAVGFSGHGFMHTPGVGRGLAEWITEGRWASIELSPLGYDRYVRGELLHESVVVSSWQPRRQ